ncbi:uncharacterized protein LOC127256592 [Andrographis paniculata]|uniref:uncharacterized protein LOC127256592 n=1 Tax=Andrographis paniculata TaxID=175694 RepID=UPI0021E88313|nr:uncharacterized protein LOC127256592 [Andrographis paniculata]
MEFSDYALAWWDQLSINRRRNREAPVRTWTELHTLMRKRFVPPHYHREVLRRLQSIQQGSRSVEEYYKELETLLLQADIHEVQEQTMSRFSNGLQNDIANAVEMCQYMDVEEMVHLAIKVEKQLKSKRMQGKDGVCVDPAKVAAIQKWPTPTSIRDVRSFQGLASFYCRFVLNFNTIAAPLTAITKKEDKFEWESEQQNAFDTLKLKLTRAPVLVLPDLTRPGRV